MAALNQQLKAPSAICGAIGRRPPGTRRQSRPLILARWVHDYNTERPHSSLGYATPAAFAAELEKQRTGSNPPVASPALMRNNTGPSLVAAG